PVADRPQIDVIAARRLLPVPATAGPLVEARGFGLEQGAHTVAETEGGSEEDVRRRAALDEVSRQLVGPRPPPAVEHPFRRRRAAASAGPSRGPPRATRLRARPPAAAALRRRAGARRRAAPRRAATGGRCGPRGAR